MPSRKSARQKRYRAMKRARGICVMCTRKQVKGSAYYCRRHLEYHQAYRRQRYREHIEEERQRRREDYRRRMAKRPPRVLYCEHCRGKITTPHHYLQRYHEDCKWMAERLRKARYQREHPESHRKAAREYERRKRMAAGATVLPFTNPPRTGRPLRVPRASRRGRP